MSESLYNSARPVLKLFKEHRCAVFKVKLVMDEPAPDEKEERATRTLNMMMSNKPRFELTRYGGDHGFFSTKSIFNRVVDKLEAMEIKFRYKYLVESYTESSRKQRLVLIINTRAQ